jgi:Bacterial Ig-like domain (group 3)
MNMFVNNGMNDKHLVQNGDAVYIQIGHRRRYIATSTCSAARRLVQRTVVTYMNKLSEIITPKIFCVALFYLLPTTLAQALTQATMSQLVQPDPTMTLLKHQPSGSLFLAAKIPFTIEVSSPNGVIVTSGVVTITDNANLIGSAPISNGVASFTQDVLSAGSHQLVACYLATANFSSSCSAPSVYTAVAPYTLAQGSTGGTINAPNVFSDELRIIPAKNFSGVVQLTCQVSSDSCQLQPSSVSFSGDGKEQIVNVSFSPTAQAVSKAFLGIPFAGLLGLVITRKQKWHSLLALLVCSTVLLCLAGCGPIVSIPVNIANQTMLVNSTAGPYGQAVTYQIQVDTDEAQ